MGWAYFCWRDGGGLVISSLSLTADVAAFSGGRVFGGLAVVGQNDRGGLPRPRPCYGGLLAGGKRLLPPRAIARAAVLHSRREAGNLATKTFGPRRHAGVDEVAAFLQNFHTKLPTDLRLGPVPLVSPHVLAPTEVLGFSEPVLIR
ncbi:hypothetical protein NDU88_010699 [Pleurodeles waltl]|uniref:Uncharacterized protein n=1 Tax=Pleurodeles waltl TaxID=8319 RepID=A0AAV7QYZ0_PLEWA|nr:hypothetical protein NDU88_010699 [Pleurodeles waltl]